MEAQFVLDTDVSSTGIGAVLSQQVHKEKRVLAYFSPESSRTPLLCFSLGSTGYSEGRQALLRIPVWEEVLVTYRPLCSSLAVEFPVSRGPGCQMD